MMLKPAELAAALRISVRQVQRLRLPYTPTGKRGKVYDLDECRRFLRETECLSSEPQRGGTLASASTINAYTDACRRVQVRAMPSSWKPSYETHSESGTRQSLVTQD